MQDLADRLVGILRRGKAHPFARAQEQAFPVGREGDVAAELAALSMRKLAPDHLEIGKRRLAVSGNQRGMCEREPRRIGRAFRIAEIDAMVLREAGRDRDREQAALSGIGDLGHAHDFDLVLARRDQPQLARFLGHQQPLIGQEGDLPRKVEMIDRRQREGLLGVGLETALVDLGLQSGRRGGEKGGEHQRAAKHQAYPVKAL